MEPAPTSSTLSDRKQPLLALALIFSLGIAIQDFFRFPLNPFILIWINAAFVWMLISWKTLSPPLPIIPLILGTSFLMTEIQHITYEGISKRDLNRLVLRVPQHLSIRGTIQNDPILRSYEEKSTSKDEESDENSPVQSEVQVLVEEINFQAAWEPARGTVLARIKGIPKDKTTLLAYGQRVEIEGVLSQPPHARNFGMFDYASFLERSNIHFLIRADGLQSVRILQPSPFFAFIFEARRWLGERMTVGLERDALASDIIRGMLLGYREDIPNDVNNSFRKTGTLHIFAISGSHISLIALSLLIALQQARFPRKWTCLIVIPILIFYVIATGLRASAIRSLIMAAVIIMGWSLRRPSELLNNLAVSALIILAWDPFQLFDAGFQLSFVVVGSLILISPFISGRLQKWCEPDPFLPRAYIPRWRTALAPYLRWINLSVAVCLAAWLGSLGLMLYYFQLISWTALLANLVIIPLASLSVTLGLMSVLLGVFWDQLAITVNMAHAVIIHCMLSATEFLASFEQGYVYFARPHVIWILTGYLALFLSIILWMKTARKRSWIAFALFSLIASTWLFVDWQRKQIRIDVLDVGSGQSILITGRNHERILIDAGTRIQGKLLVEPFLHSRGVNQIDLAVITHGDAAHYGGFYELINSIPISRIVIPEANFRSKGYRDLITQIETLKIPLQKVKKGDKLQLQSGECLFHWPSPTTMKRADDLGLIFSLNTPYGICLFGSDMGKTVAHSLSSELPTDPALFIQGIHSDEESLDDEFLSSLRPQRVVLNTSDFSAPYFRREITLKQTLKSFLETHHTGGIIYKLSPKGIESTPFLSE
jgi:competence protein ComEC